MKKTTVSSRKLKNISDSSLAHKHKKGVVVELVQPALDSKWGRFYFLQYRRSMVFLESAESDYVKLMGLLENCRELQADSSGAKLIPTELRDKLERTSVDYLIHVKLGFEYLCEEVLPVMNRICSHFKIQEEMDFVDESLLSKLTMVLSCLGKKMQIPNEIETLLLRRDIVEHPNQERLYSMSSWKNVHLAWVLSGEIDRTWEIVVILVNQINKNFEEFVAKYPIPGELQGVQRGVRVGEQFKKPRK